MRTFEYLDCNVKNNAEGFEAELIHGVNPVQVIENEVKQRSSRSAASVKLSCLEQQKCHLGSVEGNHLINLAGRLLGLNHLQLNISSCLLYVLQVFHQS